MTSLLTRTLLAAEGYLELGLPSDAEEQIERLEGEDRTTNEVWALRCKIYRAREQWKAMRDVARHLVALEPSNVEHWLEAVYATQHAEDAEAAESLLRFALKHHPTDPQIHYQMACHSARLGCLDEAGEWLKIALELSPPLKRQALDEPSLQPLWARVGL